MFDYSQVSPRNFEYIAKEYLEDNYPGTWEITSTTNDGNRDVVCMFNFADQTFEYWAEAKFTKSSESSKLQKGQLDPTLVSAMLCPRQVSIKFISNNNMPDSYIYRLTDFKIKTNIGVTLVLKDDFEKWLQMKPEICTRYGILYKNYQNHQSRNTISSSNDVKLLTGIITEIADTNMVVNKLTLGEPYYLYLIINSNKSYDNVSLRFITKNFTFLNVSTLYNNAEVLSLIPGKSGYKFCFTTNKKYIGVIDIALFENNQILTQLKLPEVTVVEPTYNNIAYSCQRRVETEIWDMIRKANKKNQIIGISGGAASGKSYMTDNLYKDLSFSYETVRFSFVESSYFNCKQICRLLMFLNIGNTESYSHEAVNLAVSSISYPEMRMFLSELNSHIKEDPNQFLHMICKKKFSKTQLIFEQHSNMRRIVILEDIHKLEEDAKETFFELLNQFIIAENNQIIIYTSRAETVSDIPHDYTAKLQGLSKIDKITTLKNYLSELPQVIHFNRYTDNLLVFANILKELLEYKTNNPNDPIALKSHILRLCEHISVNEKEVFSSYLSKYVKFNDLIELVFYIESGIQYTYLSSFFKNTDIDYLISQNIFKLVGGKVLPFHDYYVDAYKENHKIRKKSVDILQALLEIDTENSVLYLTILLDAGNIVFFKQLEKARSLRDYYFERTMFYESFLLAQAIVRKIDLNEQLSEEEVYDVFILATSSFYQKSSKDVVELYNIVLEQGVKYSNSSKMWGIILRTRTELMNQYYWDLDISELNKAFEEATNIFPDEVLDAEKQVVFSIIHRYNRHMVYSLLLNCYTEAELDYLHCIQESIRLDMPESAGYAEMDYGKGFYIFSPKDALDHMRTASAIFEKLGTEYRRHLDCLCEVAYLNCLVNGCTPQNIHDLECAATTLYRAHFNEIYSKAKLKLAALYLCLDIPNLIKAEEAIVEAEFVLPYRPCKRLQMLFANIKSVYYKLDCKHSYAQSEIKKHSMLASGLGKDYVLIANHNLTVQDPYRAEIYNGMTKSYNSLLIDPRIW